MAEPLGIASGIAGLVSLAVQLSQEVSALTDVLLRLEQALADAEHFQPVDTMRNNVPYDTITDCQLQLASQHFKLEKHKNRYVWPLQEKELKKSVEALHRFRSIFSDFLVNYVSSVFSATAQNVVVIKQSLEEENLLMRLRKHESFSKPQPSSLPGTGSWLTRHPQFIQWLSEPASILWCYGPPGVGKTMLASTAIEYLQRRANKSASCVVSYFFDFAARKQQNETAILLGILTQVAEKSSAGIVSTLARHVDAFSSTPKPHGLFRAFVDVCQVCGGMYLVLDGLDELENKNILSRLQEFVKAGCKIMVASRGHPDLRDAFVEAKRIEIQASSEDLTAYIRHRFEESDFREAIEHSLDVIDALVKRTQGLFLLAKLSMDQLLTLPTLKKMRPALQTLPPNLSEAFQSSIARIDSQPEVLRTQAYRLISWIVHAERPFRADEIVDAFAVEPEEEDLDEENFTKISTLLRPCAGFVVLDDKHRSFRMVHASAYDFFRARHDQALQIPEIYKDMAETSLRYLCIKPLRQGSCKTMAEMETRSLKLPFLKYAASYWGIHALDPDIEEKIKPSSDILLYDANLLSSSFQALNYRVKFSDRELALASFETLPHGQQPLHIAAFWGLQQSMRELIDAGVDLDATDSQSWTPLHWASSKGQSLAMDVLLNAGAVPDSKDSQLWTPLFWASLHGNVPSMQLLLDRGADYLCEDVHGWTALHWAVSRGREESVQAILDHHARRLQEKSGQRVEGTSRSLVQLLNWTDDAQSLVEIAAETLNANIFQKLIANESGGGKRRRNMLWSPARFDLPTPNWWRVMNKSESVNGIESYLRRTHNLLKADETRDKIWKVTLLHSAIKDQKLMVVKLMIEIGADVNYSLKRRALHAAAFREDPVYVTVLAHNGADVSLVDHHGQTPLHQAVLNGFERTIIALLDVGSDVNAKTPVSDSKAFPWTTDRSGQQTPLMMACGYYHKDTEYSTLKQNRVATCLLCRGADIFLEDEKGRNALHYATMAGNFEITRDILKQGINTNQPDSFGVTALHHAASSCKIDLLKLLIDSGADIRSVDHWGRSAIHFFASGNENGRPEQDLRYIFNALFEESDLSTINQEVDYVKIRGYSSNQTLNKHTALSFAIESHNWKIFQMLVEVNAALPETFHSLLHHTVEALQAFATRFLVQSGVKFEVSDSWSLFDGTKLSMSRMKWQICETIEKLESQADVEDFLLILEDLFSIGLDFSASDNRPSILDTAATHLDSAPVASFFVSHEIDLYHVSEGLDAFLRALTHGNMNFLHAMLVSPPKPIPEGHWISYFKGASESAAEDFESVISALEKSRTLNSHETSFELLLGVIKSGNCDLLDRLIHRGADTEASDGHGWRLLHHSVLLKQQGVVEVLLQAGALVNAATKTWATREALGHSGLYLGDEWAGRALHLAAMSGHCAIASTLLEHGADIHADSRSLFGPTPLHVALWKPCKRESVGADRRAVAKELLRRGARCDGVDGESMSELRNEIKEP